MKRIEIELNKRIDKNEFSKIVGFLSEDILEYRIQDDKLIVEVEDSTDIGSFIKNVEKISVKFRTNDNEEVIFENPQKHNGYINSFECVKSFSEGMLTLTGQALFLYKYFDEIFEYLLYDVFKNDVCELIEKLYPVMLPVSSYRKTGYLKRSPQYSIFCSTVIEDITVLENMDELTEDEYQSIMNSPKYSLSPSACFHVYEEYANQELPKNTIVTFVQSVFRNEGRFNFSQFGRMKDYHVREMVFIGDEEFVNLSRSKMIQRINEYIKSINMNAKMQVASDPFVLPKMQTFKKIQKMEKSKYELLLAYNDEKYMSVASFNLHGSAFTYPFSITVKGKETVTGCIGFGLERFVLCFLSQYGENVENWPEIIKKSYNNYTMKIEND